jgi:hypothetical protein
MIPRTSANQGTFLSDDTLKQSQLEPNVSGGTTYSHTQKPHHQSSEMMAEDRNRTFIRLHDGSLPSYNVLPMATAKSNESNAHPFSLFVYDYLFNIIRPPMPTSSKCFPSLMSPNHYSGCISSVPRRVRAPIFPSASYQHNMHIT